MQNEPTLIDLLSLKGKKAIVTGGSKGIGLAVSRRLIEAGSDLLIADTDESANHAVSAELNNSGVTVCVSNCDVSRETDVKEMFETAVNRLGCIDILVNVAGIYPYAPLFETSGKDFGRVLDVNLTGTFLCCKYAAGRMIAQGRGGSLINIASIEALYPSHTGMYGYDASKAGVAMITRSLAKELGRHDIRVNAIAPGGIKTAGMTSQLGGFPNQKKQLEWLKNFMSKMLLGRMGQPDEIARVVLFLASEMSSYVTGSLIVADGGYLVG